MWAIYSVLVIAKEEKTGNVFICIILIKYFNVAPLFKFTGTVTLDVPPGFQTLSNQALEAVSVQKQTNFHISFPHWGVMNWRISIPA